MWFQFWCVEQKLGFEEKSTKIRLIIHTPGHGTPWHDDGDALLNKDIDPNKWAKYWFSAIDWVPGQVFQIGKTVLSNWKAGEMWQVPTGVPHATYNFGYHLKFSVAISGNLKNIET